MDTLSISSRTPFLLRDLEKSLAQHLRVESSGEDAIVVHGVDSRAYMYIEESASAGGPLYRIMVDYSGVGAVKKIIELIADRSDVIVDNDFGTVLSGSEFVRKLRDNSDWDWRLVS